MESITEFIDICSIISEGGEYKFCPAISETEYFDEDQSVISYHIKSSRIWEMPFKRIDSRNCILLHKLAENAKDEEKMKSTVRCKACKRLICDLNHQHRRSNVSPSKQLKRLQPSSNFKLKYLSAASVTKRKKATQQE